MTEFRNKVNIQLYKYHLIIIVQASKIVKSVVKYFDIPDVKTIDQDDVSYMKLHIFTP